LEINLKPMKLSFLSIPVSILNKVSAMNTYTEAALDK
jgi:hypothetical protein